ncbi:winged helix-turn-helix transcriptional regulator [Pontivivens ytuae]|uniref:Helix-turn-helix transcriptional regulator n=1 Tax=Pontivivens ytuae TaxID=2789856 RepID=A0A7S9LQT0_9RHOB|nr:helix-turn-helix domain-containing protein [Pontivivens ytuae]QPH53596.1 helix-turn-helix transcriptional regulator [Pontivivens ytuae]
MLDDTCKTPDNCPVSRTLSIINGRWKGMILYHLQEEPRRFGALRRLLPDITQRMLTQSLRELEADGIVIRTIHAPMPPHVDYRLTDLGRTLIPLLDAMAEWGTAHPAEGAA